MKFVVEIYAENEEGRTVCRAVGSALTVPEAFFRALDAAHEIGESIPKEDSISRDAAIKAEHDAEVAF